jgi:hypothetical protein
MSIRPLTSALLKTNRVKGFPIPPKQARQFTRALRIAYQTPGGNRKTGDFIVGFFFNN